MSWIARGNGDRVLLEKDGDLLECYNLPLAVELLRAGWVDSTGAPDLEEACTQARNQAAADCRP